MSREHILYVYIKKYKYNVFSPDIFLFSEDNQNNLIIDYVGEDWYFDVDAGECKASGDYRFRQAGDGKDLTNWNDG